MWSFFSREAFPYEIGEKNDVFGGNSVFSLHSGTKKVCYYKIKRARKKAHVSFGYQLDESNFINGTSLLLFIGSLLLILLTRSFHVKYLNV